MLGPGLGLGSGSGSGSGLESERGAVLDDSDAAARPVQGLGVRVRGLGLFGTGSGRPVEGEAQWPEGTAARWRVG